MGLVLFKSDNLVTSAGREIIMAYKAPINNLFNFREDPVDRLTRSCFLSLLDCDRFGPNSHCRMTIGSDILVNQQPNSRICTNDGSTPFSALDTTCEHV